MSVAWQAVIVGVLAGLVGLVELITRYRSDPGYTLAQPAAWLYIVVNAGAGVGALFLVRAFGWTFGQKHNVELWRILVAGFGAIALFRSSFFVTKVGATNVGVGPSLVLGGLLDTFDRAVDRKSAEQMVDAIGDERLSALDPQLVMTALPVLCLALMQNFAPSDQALLGTEILKVQNDATLSAQAKMRAVLFQLSKYLGSDLVMRVLERASTVFLAPSATPAPAQRDAVIEAARNLAPLLRQPTQPPEGEQPSQ